MPTEYSMIEFTFRHYANDIEMRHDYVESTFPHPLVTIDWAKGGEPIRVVAVGPLALTVARVIAAGGTAKEIVNGLIHHARVIAAEGPDA